MGTISIPTLSSVCATLTLDSSQQGLTVHTPLEWAISGCLLCDTHWVDLAGMMLMRSPWSRWAPRSTQFLELRKNGNTEYMWDADSNACSDHHTLFLMHNYACNGVGWPDVSWHVMKTRVSIKPVFTSFTFFCKLIWWEQYQYRPSRRYVQHLHWIRHNKGWRCTHR